MKKPQAGYRHLARSWLRPLEMAVIPRLPLATAITDHPVPPAAMLCITRTKNAARVRALHEQARAAGAQCYLWALDEPISGLEHVTVGHGPGPKTDLINRIFDAAILAPDAYAVITDDDIEFAIGDLATLLRICDRGQFAVAQPAQVRGSLISFRFVLGRTPAVARSIKLVECGPLVVVSPGFRDRILPMPEAAGMGWGMEYQWLAARRPTERFGVIDAVRLRHHGLVGADYRQPVAAEEARARAIREGYGITGTFAEVQETFQTWFRRRATPPWPTELTAVPPNRRRD
jgi:hypothetical protein